MVKQYEALTIWEKVVGRRVSQACRAVEFDGFTLVVKAKNAAWRNELALHKNTIIGEINKQVQNEIIRDIRVI